MQYYQKLNGLDVQERLRAVPAKKGGILMWGILPDWVLFIPAKLCFYLCSLFLCFAFISDSLCLDVF